ncbi:MAG TPA: ParA family protein [Actinomycetales bacterium]|nr:ParA family protein [Actinomycetales bacterium]
MVGTDQQGPGDPDENGLTGTPRVVAVANQKGGVAKTTTVASLGAAFAEHGLRVLLVDLDAQACLTFSLGIDPDDVGESLHDVLIGDVSGDAVRDMLLRADDGMDLLPATIDLAGTEAHLLPRPGREHVLRGVIDELAADYDVVLLDCSPSLGVLTLNALTAADEVIIPMQCEMLSHRGVGQLLDTIADVQRILNRDLVVRGLLPTMFDARTSHGRAVLEDVGERYGVPVLSPPIPKSVRFAEAPAVGRSILATARGSKGAAAYREVARALIAEWTAGRRHAGRRRSLR